MLRLDRSNECYLNRSLVNEEVFIKSYKLEAGLIKQFFCLQVVAVVDGDPGSGSP